MDTLNLRPLRFAVGIAFCLLALTPGLPSQSLPKAIPKSPPGRQQARQFLQRRGISGKKMARALIEARRTPSLAAAAPTSSGRLSPSAISRLNQPWQPLGPNQVTTTTYGNVTGRVNSIAADPSDSTGNTVYLGTTGGGVWKSTNAAGAASLATFAPLTDTLPAFNAGALSSLSIGAVSIQPGGTGVILAGTGDPNDALDSYYGSGLLRSADSGLTWALIEGSADFSVNALANFSFVGNAFAGFAWSSQTPDLVVAAVSESAESQLDGANTDEIVAGVDYSLLGLYYSTDAGQTWLLATITDGPHQIVQDSLVIASGAGNAATAVAWNPVRKRFYAAVRYHGYYESADGVTWTRLANQPGPGLNTTECPTDPNSPGAPACPIFRGALAVQPVTGDLFVLTVDVNLLDQGLWQDVCDATANQCASPTVTFARQLPDAALEDGNGAITLGEYDLWLAAVPSAGDTLLFAGTTDIFRCSLAQGCSFRNTTNNATCSAAQVAPFQHAVDSTFAGSLSLMYFGNDSGLWRSADNVNQTQPVCTSDDANHFQNLNGGLGSLAEVQQMTGDPANPAILLAGLGANGTAATSAAQTAWPQVLDGYGSYVAIDPANTENWYAQSSLGVAIDLCTDGSLCDPSDFGLPVIGSSQIDDEAYASPQPSPFLLDPAGSANLILGTCHVWLGPADGLSWSAADQLGDLYPGEGPDCSGNALIQSLAASGTVVNSAGNFELLYAGMAGIDFDGPQAFAGHLFEASVSASAPIPATWNDLRLSPVTNDPFRGLNPQDYSISSIVSDTHDPGGQTVYVTIDGFSTADASTGLVYASTNAGATWQNITSNLPDAPVNSLAIDSNDANTVYVALDTGVYITTEISTCAAQHCWSAYGTGLPRAPVIQLATFNAGGQSLLRAGTYGRGIWQVPLITAAVGNTTITASPAALIFPPQPVQSQSAALPITLTNTGTAPFALKQMQITGDFAETDNCAQPVAPAASCAIQVTFTPTATGARSGALTVYGNLPGGQIAVPLTGTATPGVTVVLLPAAMNFGSSPIGVATTPAQNITISNTGPAAVTLQTPTVTGDFNIVANTCSASLAPNFGCTASISFTPTASGARSGVFSITDNVGTQTASLSGIGTSPATDTISPTSLTFAKQAVGTASATQIVTLTNSGDAALVLISIAVTGDFTATNGCGTSLIGHAACSFTVAYVPKQVGPEIGVLTVTDILGRPQTVALTGFGLAPNGVSALPAAMNFGDWGVSSSTPPQTIVVTDNGGAPLDNLAFAISGNFTIAANACTTTLAVNANCEVQIVFSPAASGPLTGSLTISSSSLAQPFQLALAGNGLQFLFQPHGASTATVTSGQTATYALQVIPSSGSAGTLHFTCASAPPASTCTINPTSLQIAGGVTGSLQVTIVTSGATAATGPQPGSRPLFLSIVLLPAAIFALPAFRRRRFLAAALCLFLAVLSGCGVIASGGKSSPTTPVGDPGTYTPVITASGPGITQTVTLSLVVE